MSKEGQQHEAEELREVLNTARSRYSLRWRRKQGLGMLLFGSGGHKDVEAWGHRGAHARQQQQ